LDDVQLFDAISSFLSSTTDHNVVPSPNFDDPAVRHAWGNLEQDRISLALVFTLQTKLPKRMVQKHPTSSSKARNVVQDISDIDRAGPEDLVEHLDSMACAAFSNVNEEVLYRAHILSH
jgi:GTPase-activating protein BEM2